ncbi:hypothetical protein M011DRAFT_408938 [Sporormia fimetaria CBS 119925]|uniref:Uncharacterized protein n=1 Tax=Sporormia fimetaria CBS 119925 TaxID=1340428 RepID=A0A6A6V4U2_9PLEO|nr:hypothetical protein M011DRAFT_408938 [Sporormia fimetaria CBS 119925]
MSCPPTVLYPLTLVSLLHFVLATQVSTGSTTLIICSSREAFFHHVAQSVKPSNDSRHAGERFQLHFAPTLRNLLAAQHVHLAFCDSVPALRAYLSAYRGVVSAPSVQQRIGGHTLMLINPLSLHAESTSFSAQGLSRTFAGAVETALRLDAKLLMVETTEGHNRPVDVRGDDPDAVTRPGDNGGAALETSHESLGPWDQEVPMLNDSVRRFVSRSGQWPWAGRTVQASRVAGRWFRFCRLAEEEP